MATTQEEVFKKMLDIRNRTDAVIRESIESYQQRAIYDSSYKINYRRILFGLNNSPEQSFDRLNKAVEARGKTFDSIESAIDFCKGQIKRIEQFEEEKRKAQIRELNAALPTVEDWIREDKEDTSNSSISYESYEAKLLMREIYKKDLEIRNCLQTEISKLEIAAAGKKGEDAVDYALKWMQASGYCSILKDCLTPYGTVSILLKNEEYIDEPQEFDHILIGQNGIFLIETKNFSGTITVTNSGDWIQEKNGISKGIKNPIQQCNRHEALIKSIVGSVPIVSIICLANDGVVIQGRDNCKIPVVKVELLEDFICCTQAPQELSKNQIVELIQKINRHKVSERLNFKAL